MSPFRNYGQPKDQAMSYVDHIRSHTLSLNSPLDYRCDIKTTPRYRQDYYMSDTFDVETNNNTTPMYD